LANLSTIFEKLRKLKRVWREQGTQELLIFIYQRVVARLERRNSYQKWLAKTKLTQQEITSAKQLMTCWQLRPKISVIMPVYNTDARWLQKAIESVRNQIYDHWELCIADDASTASHVRPLLTHYSKVDPRIKIVFRAQNANISAASSSALEVATGDYIALLDHDDELAIDALFENAKLINAHPEADFIYSDEDKLDTKGNRLDPFFKPDWSPDYFHGCMYTCHLGVYRTGLIRDIGGFRSEYDGAQDYDLVLRVVEKTQNIYHIPKVLYHWRIIPTSVTSGEQAKPWAFIAAKKALEAMLERSPYPGYVEAGPRAGFFRVRRNIMGQPLISIIIPSAGQTIETANGSLCLLENCLRSIQQLSTYTNFEVIVVDGYDIPKSTLKAIAAPNVHFVHCSEPFNFSMRINQGAAKAKGQFLLLLNDDTEILTPDWLESMLELAQQDEIGAVGAKLFFPDGKIQHAGVMILEGNPGHPFHGYEADYPGYFCSTIINRNYLAVTGACLMIRTELFHQVHGLDEGFPFNYNDVDFCLKLVQAGYRNVVTPFVQLVHYESASREGGLRPGEWEQLNHKWSQLFNGLKQDPYYNPNLSSQNCNFELV
jgi:GT2 family glycosyltransferase